MPQYLFPLLALFHNFQDKSLCILKTSQYFYEDIVKNYSPAVHSYYNKITAK